MSRFRGSYVDDWPEVSEAVRSDADWRCIRCGHPDDPRACAEMGAPRGFHPCGPDCSHPDDGRKRVLTVHHLDGDRSNNRWWNLLALCQVCHLQVQAKVVPEVTYLWPHSEWFRPYVAGYYAFTLLGEDLKREETEDRMGELLSVGQPWLNEATP